MRARRQQAAAGCVIGFALPGGAIGPNQLTIDDSDAFGGRTALLGKIALRRVVPEIDRLGSVPVGSDDGTTVRRQCSAYGNRLYRRALRPARPVGRIELSLAVIGAQRPQIEAVVQ